MSDAPQNPEKKLIIDEDWKSQVEAEREAARHSVEAEKPAESGPSPAARGPLPPAEPHLPGEHALSARSHVAGPAAQPGHEKGRHVNPVMFAVAQSINVVALSAVRPDVIRFRFVIKSSKTNCPGAGKSAHSANGACGTFSVADTFCGNANGKDTPTANATKWTNLNPDVFFMVLIQ